jgi:hypothetical protein
MAATCYIIIILLYYYIPIGSARAECGLMLRLLYNIYKYVQSAAAAAVAIRWCYCCSVGVRNEVFNYNIRKTVHVPIHQKWL